MLVGFCFVAYIVGVRTEREGKEASNGNKTQVHTEAQIAQEEAKENEGED